MIDCVDRRQRQHITKSRRFRGSLKCQKYCPKLAVGRLTTVDDPDPVAVDETLQTSGAELLHFGTRWCSSSFLPFAELLANFAERERRNLVGSTNVNATAWLHEQRQARSVPAGVVRSTESLQAETRQFGIRSSDARRDAEDSERSRWLLQILAEESRNKLFRAVLCVLFQ